MFKMAAVTIEALELITGKNDGDVGHIVCIPSNYA
jgi:hypothetical protein